MTPARIIDVKPATVDRCVKCGKACCPCDICRRMKGNRRDICATCFRADALAPSKPGSSPAIPSVRPGGVL